MVRKIKKKKTILLDLVSRLKNNENKIKEKSQVLLGILDEVISIKEQIIEKIGASNYGEGIRKSLASNYMTKENLSGNLGLYKKSLELDSNNIEALSSKARVLIFKEDYLGAIECCKKILRLDGSNIEAFLNLSSAYIYLDNYIEAEKNMEGYYKAINSGDEDKLCFNKILKYNSQSIYYFEKEKGVNKELKILKEKEKDFLRNFKEFISLETFKKILEETKKEIKIVKYINLAEINRYKNKKAEALCFYRKALKERKEKDIYINLGIFYMKEKQYKKALKYFEIIERKFDTSADKKFNGQLYNNIGVVYFYLKDYINSIIYFKKAIKSDNRGLYNFNLGVSNGKINNGLRSIIYFERSIKLDDKNKQSRFLIGRLILEYLKDSYKLKDKTKNRLIEIFIDCNCYFFEELLTGTKELEECLKLELSKKIKDSFINNFKIQEKWEIEDEISLDKEFYMYKSINVNLLKNLNENKIFKSDPSYFNDPFDPYYKKKYNKVVIEEDDCLKNIILGELNKIRISCFSEKSTDLLMWGHYGDNHKGICIGYKLDKNLDDLTCFKRINYNGFKTNQDFKDIGLYNLKEKDTSFYQMCLRKHKNWEYEKEFRLINLNSSENYYDKLNISEIIFGMNCNLDDQELIKTILKDRNDIKYFRIEEKEDLTLRKTEIF